MLLVKVVSGLLFFSRDENWNGIVYCIGIFFSENAIVNTRKIMKFLTGSFKLPSTGLNKHVTVKFKQGCFPSKSGNTCKYLSTVSKCEIIVNILVHITSEEDMTNAFKVATMWNWIWSYLKVLQAQVIRTKN